MREALNEFAKIVSQRKNHFIVLHGNVYDIVNFNNKEYTDINDFIVNIESSKILFPWCMTYDIFSGTKIERGNAKEIYATMGIKTEEKKKGVDAELIQALKQARGEQDGELPIEPEKIFTYFDTLLHRATKPTLIIIDFADTLTPATVQNANNVMAKRLAVGLSKWSKDKKIRELKHLVILTCRQAAALDEGVLDRSFEGVQIRISKPNEEERKEFFDKEKTENSLSLSKATAGLSYKDLKNIAFQIPAGGNILDATFDLKQKILRDEYGDIMEVMKPRFGYDAIGGLEHLITEFKFISKAMREGNTALVPQGILMMGPPGTGKTCCAEAAAKDAGVNFVKPIDLKSMWLGESERRATKFYNALKDLAPVVVWIDEIDQYQKQRGGFDGDSGVSGNLFKKMLEFMSDPQYRGKVLFIFATNRPDLLDSALKRDGRCDLRVALLPPDTNQLALICEASFRQYPDMKAEIKDWKKYAKKCEGYNGANMVEIVRRAWVRAVKCGEQVIKGEHMEWALKDYIPQRADKKEIAEMSLISILNCSSGSMLPSNWKELQRQYEEILGKYKENKVMEN